jgi:hypothetical protein
MEECDLFCLETGTTDDVIEVLKKFIEKVSAIVDAYVEEEVTRCCL